MITIGRISATLVSPFPVKGGLPHFAQDISFESLRIAGCETIKDYGQYFGKIDGCWN
jgi:hypothetical protein